MVKDYWVLGMTFLLAGLMVSNITYHSMKEANLKERRPFGILVIIVAFLAFVAYHPALVLFFVSMILRSRSAWQRRCMDCSGKQKTALLSPFRTSIVRMRRLKAINLFFDSEGARD